MSKSEAARLLLQDAVRRERDAQVELMEAQRNTRDVLTTIRKQLGG